MTAINWWYINSSTTGAMMETEHHFDLEYLRLPDEMIVRS